MLLVACTTTRQAPPVQAPDAEAAAAADRLHKMKLHRSLYDGIPRFARRSDTVDAKTREVLSAYVRTFLKYNLRFRIEGHADDCDDEATNQRLSERRAENVRRELLALGLPEHLIVSVSGMGSTQPMAKSPPCSYPFHDRVELNMVHTTNSKIQSHTEATQKLEEHYLYLMSGGP